MQQPNRGAGRLAGQIALITGAGLGIGRATALRFATEGARLVLADRNTERLQETVALLGAIPPPRGTPPSPQNVLPVVADVTDEAQVVDLLARAEAFGPVDILINNVGGGRAGRIWDLTIADWDYTMTLSLRSMFLCTRAAVPNMMARKRGRIVCLSSAARHGSVWNSFHVGACAYSTAKAGVIGFVRDLAIELADHGITINAVAPGPIDTELAGPVLRRFAEDRLEYDPVRMVPMHRLGTPREVADAILFLASSEASYITGTTLDVAGGR